ncbi:uncharacterized protein LOC141653767 isoform X2 [Silene latifolia]|uniref:uncharacterized protein LOC141653767 isoform X2 n=1 Tax=Silene latifolia TaxID=37657 RepID=UPI003D76C687
MDQPVAYWSYPRRVEEAAALCIEFALENALILDDKDEFLRLIKLPDFKQDRDLSDPEEIFRLDALNCCMAVLNGETKGLIDIQDILVEGLTPLQLAALHCSVRLTKYLLERGDSVDVHPDLINRTIKTISSGHNARRWNPRLSVYELLVVLCSCMRRQLEVLRMLVQNTENKESVRQTFMDYADKREMVPVALLFLAAPELFWSSYFVIPEVASSSIATLYHVLYSLEKRTDIEEAMLLLVDALAMAGHKFVAYTRLQYPNKQAYLRSYLDVAFLVREVALNNQGLSSPDDCFLRFFKPVRQEADQLINIPGQKRVRWLGNCRVLPFELKRHDLDQTYINTVLPSLTTEDAVPKARSKDSTPKHNTKARSKASTPKD